MKNKIFKLLVLAFLFFLVTPATYAQEVSDSTTLWTITTLDGNEYIGVILSEDSKAVQLRTKTLGVIFIALNQIEHREKIDKANMVGDEFWFENPQATRYFWGPNGYGLKKGEGYYQNIGIFANQVSYGLTDNFTLGVGTVPLFLFGGLGVTPFWITPKISVPVVPDQFNMGAGAIFVGIPGEGYAGLAYGSATFGSRNNNASINLGYGVVDGEWSKAPTISLSFMKRLNRRTYLLSENYYLSVGSSDGLGVISLGARTVWDKISLDYGLVRPIFFNGDADGFIGLPWLGFSIPLGELRRGH